MPVHEPALTITPAHRGEAVVVEEALPRERVRRRPGILILPDAARRQLRAGLGLAAGIALPFAVWSLLPWGRPEDERPGPALAIAGAIIALLAIAGTTVGVSVVFREPAVRLFLMGLAASGIAGAIVSWSEQRGWTAAPVTAASLFAALLAVTAAQPLQDFSAEAGRPEKVHALIVISAALIVFYALTEVWRWFAERRGAPPA